MNTIKYYHAVLGKNFKKMNDKLKKLITEVQRQLFLTKQLASTAFSKGRYSEAIRLNKLARRAKDTAVFLSQQEKVITRVLEPDVQLFPGKKEPKISQLPFEIDDKACEVYETCIKNAFLARGGKAKKQELKDLLVVSLAEFLTEDDWKVDPKNPNRLIWHSKVDYYFNKLSREGILRKSKDKNIWKISID